MEAIMYTVGQFSVDDDVLFEAKVLGPIENGARPVFYQGPKEIAEWVADALNTQLMYDSYRPDRGNSHE
jgi:hypothetical protein